MATNLITAVENAELEAIQTVNKAKNKSVDIIKEAQERSSKVLSSTLKGSKEQAESIIDGASRSEVVKQNETQVEIQKSLAGLKASVKSQKENVVELVINTLGELIAN